MRIDDYRLAIDEFYHNMAIDKPDQAAIDSWFEYLGGYSITVLTGALNHLRLTLERRPYNMMATIRQAADIYMRENPGSRSDPDYGECEDCGNEGIFHVNYAPDQEFPEHKQSAIIICGSCENWRKVYGSTQGKLVLKKFEVEYRGFELVR